MKLSIETGGGAILRIEEFDITLPEREKDRAECMIMLSEALVLLANACEADTIEDAASDMSDSIRRGFANRHKVTDGGSGITH